jgi:hypothetical protein
MLTGMIVGVVIACVGLVAVALRQGKQQKVLKAQLAARGIAMVPALGAMQLPPNPLMRTEKLAVLWSAHVPGTPPANIYSLGALPVVAWRTAQPRPGAFVVATPIAANPAPATLQKVPKKQLPKPVQVFSSHPAVTDWLLGTNVLNAFALRFREHAWYFTVVEGNCYIHTSDGAWAGLDDLMRTVAAFEHALGAVPGQSY